MEGKVSGVRYGYVVNNIDDTGADRIAVRLIPEDNSTPYNEDLEVDAIPLLPKMFRVIPKIGEGVFVFLATSNDGYSQRHYIGPVVSQAHRMYYEPAQQGGDAYQRGGKKDFDVNPYINEEAYGAYPSLDDIAIVGRKNCDIIIKNDDIRIRAGVKLVDDYETYKVSFNRQSPAYIKLKHHSDALDGDTKSTAAVVADKIMLLSNKSVEPDVNTVDSDDLLTDEEMNKVIQDAYRLPYGEKLVKLLKTMINVFCTHTHDYSCLPPNAAFIEEIRAASNEPLEQEKLLSDTIRIN